MASGLTESINPLFLMVDLEWGIVCNFICDDANGNNNPLDDPCEEVASNRVGFIRAHDDATITVDGAGLLYKATPEMEFEMIDSLKGGTSDEPFRVLMPLHLYPVNVMVGNPFPLTRITVWQCRMGTPGVSGTWGGANYSRRMLARGFVGRTTARYNGRPDIVSMECYRNKSQMQSVSLGITTSQRCSWRFGDSRCDYPLADATATNVLVTNIANQDMFLTIDGASTIGAGLAGMSAFAAFQQGYAEYQGLKILIREHLKKSGNTYVSGNGNVVNGDIKLLLTFKPPTHPNYTWNNKRITLVGGCTKNKSACQDKWNNAVHFGGFGLLIPTYNPVWEIGGGAPG